MPEDDWWLVYMGVFVGRFNFVFLAVAIALIGCSKSADIERAKQSVAENLSDPASAQFRNVEAYGDGVVCGEFNARNRFGGYVGFRPFTYGSKMWESSVNPSPEDVRILCVSDTDRRRAFLSHKLKDLEPGCAQTTPMPGTPCAEVFNARQELNGLIFK